MVQTNLIGEYVSIPDEGDAGWVRAFFVAEDVPFVLVQRNNVSRDMRIYYVENIVIPEVNT